MSDETLVKATLATALPSAHPSNGQARRWLHRRAAHAVHCPVSHAAQFIVDQNKFNSEPTITPAAPTSRSVRSTKPRRARAGDLVLVKAGLYREWVPLYHSGTRETPIRIQPIRQDP